MMATAEERVKALVVPIIADLGLDLYDFEYAGGVVRVTLDKPGGVDLEAIALATRLISREMDHVDPISGRYTLEVSSPGLERNLRTPSHFQRIVGWTVNVRTQASVEGDRRAQGVLSVADDDGITVTFTKGKELLERRLAYGDIERARTVFEWAKTEKAATGIVTANKTKIKPSSKAKAPAKTPATPKTAPPKTEDPQGKAAS
jgi:ribosome maturation factor RimP